MAAENDLRPRDSNLPVPDPTRLTTQQLLRELGSLEMLLRQEITGLRDAATARMDAMEAADALRLDALREVRPQTERQIAHLERLHDEKFASIVTQFAERDIRAEQAMRALKADLEILRGEIRNVQDVSSEKFLAIEGTFASNALALTAALAAQKEAASEAKKSSDLAIDRANSATKETILANAAQTTSGLASQAATIADLKDRIVRIEAGGLGAQGQRAETRQVTAGQAAIAALILTAAAIIVTILFATGH